MHGSIYIHLYSDRGIGILPFAYIICHFLYVILNIDILSLLGAGADLSTLNAIFFFGCSTGA
jgi:hypothetical protein